MVGGSVQNKHIRAEKHHSGEHTSCLFTAAQHANFFVNAVIGEKHSAEEAAQICFGLVFGILSHPVKNGERTAVEESGIVVREIRVCYALSPFIRTAVGVGIADKNLKKRGYRHFVADKRDLFALVDGERDVLEKHGSVGCGFGKIFNEKNILARFSVHVKADERITAA